MSGWVADDGAAGGGGDWGTGTFNTEQDYACDHGSEMRLVSYQIALSIQ